MITIIHEATTVNPDPAEFMPIEVNSAFPKGAVSTFNSQEKAQIDRFINEVPDKNDTRAINYWRVWGDREVYLEGWIDKCLAGTGFPKMEGGEWEAKIEYMVRDTPRTLIAKQTDGSLSPPFIVAKLPLTLIEGGFREFEAGEKSWLYGVTWGVYKKEGSLATSTHPLTLKQYPLGKVPEKVKADMPRILSMEEYEQTWKPQGWRLIIIGPTSTWRQDWGEWEAIRDIVQNALDEAESYRCGYDSKGFWIADTGKGVAVADFLLGPPKLKPDYARGKFGEGMKIAALALVRKGYSVHVKTVGRELWIIFMEQEAEVKVPSLAALWRYDGTTRGTKFHIIGYSGPDFGRCFAVNLPRTLILAEVPSPLAQPIQRYNQLIKAEGMASSPVGGVIYARDIFLENIKSSFSYNLWGFELAHDRHGPETEASLWVDIGRLWCGISNVFLLEQFLPMVLDPPRVPTDESRKISMDVWPMGKEPTSGKRYSDLVAEHQTVWQTAWLREVGDNVVIRTTERWDGMVKHLGYISVSVQWGVRDVLSTVIMTDKQLIQESQEALKKSEVVDDAKLTNRAFVHLNLARAIAFYFSDVAGVYAAVIPRASDKARTAGLYDVPTRVISLHLETLESARDTIDAMVHELGHHIATMRVADPIQAEDLQPAHSEAMTYVAARIFKLTAERKFDEYLKEAVW